MRHWFGIVLACGGAWLLYAGFAHRARFLAVPRLLEKPSAKGGPLAVFGDVLRPLIIVGVTYFGLKAGLVYAMVDGGRIFSLFDLAGLWFLLASYATWLVLKTNYRLADGSALAVQPTLEPLSTVPERPVSHDFGPPRPDRTSHRPGDRSGLRGVRGRVVETGEAA